MIGVQDSMTDEVMKEDRHRQTMSRIAFVIDH
jgi:hypothetical protein